MKPPRARAAGEQPAFLLLRRGMTSVQQAGDTALSVTDIELLRWLGNNRDTIAIVFGLEQRMNLANFSSFMRGQGLNLTEEDLGSLSKLLDVDGNGRFDAPGLPEDLPSSITNPDRLD